MLAVDILAGRVYRGRVRDDGALERVRVYQLPETVGMIAPVEGDDGWLLGAGRGFVYLAPDGTQRTIAEVVTGRDPDERRRLRPPGPILGRDAGRRPPRGRRRALPARRDGRIELMLDGLTISNGIGWSPDGRTMYLVDSGPRVIHAFAFDARPGHASPAARILVTVPEDIGAPDGMTVDAAGDLWVAIYGGGRVHRYAPDGQLRQVLTVPARQCTCCAFGGPRPAPALRHDRDRGLDDEQRRAEPAAGLVYRCDTDATGRPAAPFRPDPDWWQKVTG